MVSRQVSEETIASADRRSLDQLRLLMHSTLHVPFYCSMIKNPAGVGISIDGGYGDALGDAFDRGEFQNPLSIGKSIAIMGSTSEKEQAIEKSVPCESFDSDGTIKVATCFEFSNFYWIRNAAVVVAYLLSIALAAFVIIPSYLLCETLGVPSGSSDELVTKAGHGSKTKTKSFVVSIGDYGHVCDTFTASSWALPPSTNEYISMRDKAFCTATSVLEKGQWSQMSTKVRVSKNSKLVTVLIISTFWIARVLEVLAAFITCSPSGWGYSEATKE